MDLIPASAGSPQGGHGNPGQYSYLENPLDRRAWPATVHGIAKSQTMTKATLHAQTRRTKKIFSGCVLSSGIVKFYH